MLTVAGYEILETIYESSRSIVCRAVRAKDGLPVVLKALAKDNPPPEEIARRRHEYAILRNLNVDGVIGIYGLEERDRGPILVLEDFGAEPLNWRAKRLPPTVSEILGMAIRLVSILGKLHTAHIIHKDINPSNVVCCPETGTLKIIDFDIAGIFSREDSFPRDPARFHGTLPYISPEQTGRTSRLLDYRTDYYALGVTLYELLCGCLPFETSDTLELVHCHIALMPTPPAELIPNIPQALSDIVMKLLAKNASDRYQSSRGIRADMEQCFHRLNTWEKGETFPLGRSDRPARFHVPQKLYGREQEIHTLLDAFERVKAGGKEVMMVTGDPGVGKTVLVREIYEPVTRALGAFVYGKCDQFHSDPRHFSIIDVFRQLVRQRLMESDDALSMWRQETMDACGNNAKILLEVIPELEHIIGPQPDVPDVIPVEAQNRFNRLFRSFVRIWCKREHPLVLFLDDLQWVDASSLRLLELLMSDDELGFLLVIAAYRPAAMSHAHPFMRSVSRMTGEGVVIDGIRVLPLALEQVAELVSDALGTDRPAAAPLADLILERTGGNPFFINEYLRSLYEAKLIDFDLGRGVWLWNLQQVQLTAITDNVVDLMSVKIRALHPRTQELVKLASCIGNRFDLGILTAVSEHSASDIMEALREAVSEGLMLALGSVSRQGSPEEVEPDDALPLEFAFSHDRIQQTTYELIPESERPALHLGIGRVLRSRGDFGDSSEKLFRVVDHFNSAWHLLGAEQEKYELAGLNLAAGKHSKAATAQEAALRYFNVGIALLERKGWELHYQLALDLHLQAAEAAYLCADFETCERYCQRVIENARGDLDRVKAYDVRIQACIARYEMVDAVRNAVTALGILGVSMPERPSRIGILAAVLKTKYLLWGKKIESLIDMPDMTAARPRAALRIMSSAAKAVYAAVPELMPHVVCNMVNLSIKHGNAPESTLAYATYGVVLVGVLDDIDRGYQFGELALTLAQRYGIVKATTRPVMAVHFFIKPWKEHYRQSIQHFKFIYESALELGNFEDAAHCAYFYCTCLFRIGENLVMIEQEMAAYGRVMRKLHQHTAYRLISVFHQVVLNLLGTAHDPRRLTGEAYDEDRILPLLHSANDLSSLCVTYANKLMLCYLFRDYAQALEHSRKAEPYLRGVRSTASVPNFYFYDALTRVALYSSAARSEKRNILRTVASHMRKMRKWAHHAPANHLHKSLLLEAERFRVLGKDAQAVQCYLHAGHEAEENAYINEEALIHELTGRFYLSRGDRRKAKVSIRQARYCYEMWGARAKTKDIDETYSDLLTPSAENVPPATEESKLATTGTGELGLNLDHAAVVRASQAISGEIVLDRLLDRLMNIVIESAGAQRGLLILESETGLIVRAEVTAARTAQTLLHMVPIEHFSGLAPSIVRYVARTRESVVLDDAARHGMFTSDAYILANQPRSILCAALTHRQKLLGVLYLENNLATGTFSANRVELLSILCAQAAISIENALLYERMEQLVAERTAQLQWSNEELRREIAVRERAQRALYKAKIEAETANRAKSEFLANMSHELRTPLNAVIGFSELLQDQWPGTLNEKQLRYVAQIWESGRHLLQLINDILDLAKVESGKMELQPCDVRVIDLLQDSLDMVRGDAREKSLELTVLLPEDLKRQVVFADKVKIKQILLNLLSNALKFTPEGGRVTVEGQKNGTLLHFRVTDTGVGVKPEDSDRIFAAFEQADSSLARRQQGTGLGLALSRSLAELHGGRLWVASEGEAKGSTFTLEIPVEGVEQHVNETACADAYATDNPSHPAIMVVEDSEPDLRFARDLLEAAGYSVLRASTADEGIRMAGRQRPAVILMDISLPGMNGLAAISLLKQDPKTSDIPVVAFTGPSTQGDRDRAIPAGCYAYVPKPIDKTAFLDTVARVLSLNHPGDS